MKILMVSSESVPFSKSGGLADVVGALSKALCDTGHDARVFVPLYNCGDPASFAETAASFNLRYGGKTHRIDILEKRVGSVIYYFCSHPWFTERKGIYGDTSFEPYGDNGIRFMLQALSVEPMLEAVGFKPDAVHAHDWTAGLLPHLLKGKYKTVFTIHNLAYQGTFPRLDLLLSEIPYRNEIFTGTGRGRYINMMQAGIRLADAVTTVSPTYAKEILTPEFGCGMEGYLRERGSSLFGILNGIDMDEWNPMKDAFLDKKFSTKDLSGKLGLKREVLSSFGLKDEKKPLISIISRFAEQKGFFELIEPINGGKCALEEILDMGFNMVIIGTGDERIAGRFRQIAEKHTNLSVNIMFNVKASHLVEAGSDFFLMPSRYEPCGLNQMYSLRYGTLPIARKTGGLADSILDGETGFLFSEPSGQAIVDTVKKAFTIYSEGTERFEGMRHKAMAQDFSWERSADEYVRVYEMVK